MLPPIRQEVFIESRDLLQTEEVAKKIKRFFKREDCIALASIMTNLACVREGLQVE